MTVSTLIVKSRPGSSAVTRPVAIAAISRTACQRFAGAFMGVPLRAFGRPPQCSPAHGWHKENRCPESEGWEGSYAVARKLRDRFPHADALKRALEEARAGWDLLEKFDNARARLRQHVK